MLRGANKGKFCWSSQLAGIYGPGFRRAVGAELADGGCQRVSPGRRQRAVPADGYRWSYPGTGISAGRKGLLPEPAAGCICDPGDDWREGHDDRKDRGHLSQVSNSLKILLYSSVQLLGSTKP